MLTEEINSYRQDHEFAPGFDMKMFAGQAIAVEFNTIAAALKVSQLHERSS